MSHSPEWNGEEPPLKEEEISQPSGDELDSLEKLRNSLLAELQDEEEEPEDDQEEADTLRDQPFKDEHELSYSASEDCEEEEEENVDGWTSEEEMLERALLEADPEQIDNLLEQPLDGNMEMNGRKANQQVKSRLKRVLEFRPVDHLNVLPDGWVEITHASGLPVFLHRPSRVCTLARPYSIGRCSVRNHSAPESAVPCLFQRKYQDEMEAAMSGQNGNAENATDDQNASSILVNKLNAPCVKVRTQAGRAQLSADQLHEYAKRLFRFKQISVFRFGKWNEARTFYKRKRRVKQVLAAGQKMQVDTVTNERPSLPAGLKLITVPALERESNPHKRPFYLNPQGKTSVSILHEFVQKALKCSVRYFFSETRSSTSPYNCVVKLVLATMAATPTKGRGSLGVKQQKEHISAEVIKQRLAQMREYALGQQNPKLNFGSSSPANEELNSEVTQDPEFVVLGEGTGAGKLIAKLLAAKDALEKLVPGIEFDVDGIALEAGNRRQDEGGVPAVGGACPLDSSMASTSSTMLGLNDSSSYIFDMIGITDSRVPELCARAGQPSPYVILQEYLKRFSAFGDTAISLTSRQLRHQRHEFKLTVGEHSVKVVSGNKREGKQSAAQAMLKKLHPKNESWGSILRLYGYEAQQKFREARKSKDSVVKLQGAQDEEKVGQFQPNAAILDKLRAEMLNLSEDLICKEVCSTAHWEIARRNTRNTTPSFDLCSPAKIRRADFPADLPILSEEQLRTMSAKMEKERPDLRKCVPNIRL